MKKVLIATFSQAGSTKKIADQIAKGLSSSDWEIDYFNISEKQVPYTDEYDVIGIGTPTYFFNPPFIVKDFVNNLRNLQDKSSFVFVLHGTHRGDCGNWIRRKLKSKGTKDIGYFTSYGADYWLGYIKRGVMFSPESPTESELAAAEKFGEKVAAAFTEQNPEVDPFDPSTPIMYGLERMLVARPFAKLMYSKTFSADKNCDNCGICIQECPVQNITEKSNGKPKWHSNCMLCATCELSCPKDAVHSAFDWFIFAPFMNYNIRASKNKNIPYANVEHAGGKTQLI
jgi:flavodoxin/NAD-dependent dihydropyrimidine dehydrogenase PreA subunit